MRAAPGVEALVAEAVQDALRRLRAVTKRAKHVADGPLRVGEVVKIRRMQRLKSHRMWSKKGAIR